VTPAQSRKPGTEGEPMSELTQLRNIGKAVAERLVGIGVRSEADLRALGSAKAYQRIRAKNASAHLPLCYYLYSLEGALQDKDWRDFSEKQKRGMQKKAGLLS